MKLTKDDLVLGLTKLHDDIQKFANECRISGFQKEYVKLFDAQAIIANLWDDLYKEQNSEIKSSTVYSDSFDEMVQKDFTYKGNKYTWNDSDCVYYNDNGDEEDFFMEIPEGAITSSKKPIKSGIGPIGTDYEPDITVFSNTPIDCMNKGIFSIHFIAQGEEYELGFDYGVDSVREVTLFAPDKGYPIVFNDSSFTYPLYQTLEEYIRGLEPSDISEVDVIKM